MFDKILFLNFEKSNLKPEYWKRIEKISNKIVLGKADSPNLVNHLSSGDCLVLKLGMGADKTLIDSMPKLKFIGMYGTGYGRVDTKYAKKKHITVCNIANYATEGVAEFVIGNLLEHLREVTRAKIQAQTGNYSEASYTGTELADKTFGIVGLGNIGRRVGELAQGFNCNVVYWSKSRKKDAEKSGITYQPINKLLASSQIITLHMAFNPQTKGFVSAQRLKLIKPGAIIINTAPMELVDIVALEQRLKKKDIAFILDHSDELDPVVAKRLSKHDNCILYPPIGYTTKEATKRKQEIFVANLENFLHGKPTNKVN